MQDRARPAEDAPPLLAERAADNLRFIRSAMESSSRFTDVSGVSMVLIGVTGLVATVGAAIQPGARAAALTWEAAAVVAVAIGLAGTVHKARGHRERLLAAPARKFALGLAPPLAAGGVLTIALQRAGAYDLLPGMWLLVYGAAIAAAGAFSVRILPALGVTFMVTGTLALIAPPEWANPLMGVGFGGLHLVFGATIARRYGG